MLKKIYINLDFISTEKKSLIFNDTCANELLIAMRYATRRAYCLKQAKHTATI